MLDVSVKDGVTDGAGKIRMTGKKIIVMRFNNEHERVRNEADVAVAASIQDERKWTQRVGRPVRLNPRLQD